MHRRLAAWVCALTLAAIAVALPSSAPTVEAATACTNWKSTYTPPTTIRVLRSYGAASGSVQVVPFRDYVENVLAWEWPETYPTQALRAGAVAVKQYGWYYARTWRGGKTSSGACYDVKDTSVDQIYRPETRSAGSNQLKAVEMTWNLSIRRTRGGTPGTFILTGYLPGSVATCGAEKNGYRLYQKGVKACANDGLTYEQIARIYYGKTLQLTDPGRHNIAGSPNGPGDSGAVVPDTGDIDVHVLQSSGTAFVVGASPDTQPTDDSATLARISADLDGDGFDELISLIADGPTSQHIEVRKPNGLTYGAVDAGLAWDSVTAGVTFASERDGAPGIRLVAGDFDNDYDEDLALVVTGDEPAAGSIELLRSSKTSFKPLVETYAGVFDPGTSRAFAGDATGDGRADILLETPGADGLAFRVMATTATDWLLADPVTWYTAAGLTMDATRSVLADVDRNGRDDFVLALSSGSKTVYRGLRSTGSTFNVIDLYASSIVIDRIKLATSDVDHDGRGDMVVFASLADGSSGTRVYVYRSRGSSLARAELWREDLGLDWQKVEPY